MNNKDLPPRLTTALTQLTQLNQLGIYLLPIRHHSPACAYATRQALQDLQGKTAVNKLSDILIEAPASFDELLSDLQHPDNKPPIAVLCQTKLKAKIAVPLDNDSGSFKSAESSDSAEQDADKASTQYEYETLEQLRSAYFPFCEYSPEWVALKWQSADTHIQCIDLPWSQQVQHEYQTWQQDGHSMNGDNDINAQSLQQERYLAHSQYVKALANKLHCRNHDEVWEHLFELDGTEHLQDWRGFFNKVLVWCAMSRLDYEDSVLEREGSTIREGYMVERIIERVRLRDKKTNKKTNNNTGNKNSTNTDNKNIVVVTGGFHTLALIEQLSDILLPSSTNGKPQQKHKKSSQPSNKPSSKPASQPSSISSIQTTDDESWLIRYSFDRLDALNGYASGMPSPAFYQARWEEMTATRSAHANTSDTGTSDTSLIMDFLSGFSHQLRQQHILQSNFTTVKTANEQAIRLAHLREHRVIGRFDLLDACYSSFIKGSRDEGYQAFHQLLHTQLGGSALGSVVSTTRTPPILAQVRALVQSHRFKLDDTLNKTAKLDVLRKDNHRKRSCLLHLLMFLEVGFARRISGPDFLQGGQLHLLFEEWSYAWTPQVEARLIELSELGSDIYQIATQQLLSGRQQLIEEGLAQSSAEIIRLLVQASLMGLNEQTEVLFDEIYTLLPSDPDINSVLACGQHLLYLWTGRKFLNYRPAEMTLLKQLINQLPMTALFLLSQQQQPSQEQAPEALSQLLALRNLLKQIQTLLNANVDDNMDDNIQMNTHDTDKNLIDDYHQTLSRLLPNWQDRDLLLGAVHALQFVDNICQEETLATRLKNHFGVGANAEQAVAYLSGCMQAVPTLFVHYQGMSVMLDSLVAGWDNETFIALLPDLRLAFTGLKPMQTNEFAEQVASLHGVSGSQISQYQAKLSEDDMMQGVVLNQKLDEILRRQGLWG